MAKTTKKKGKAAKAVKTNKAAKKTVKEEILLPHVHCEDDFCDFDDIFADDVMDDAAALDFFEQFSHVVDMQSQIAVDLTKIIVDHQKQGTFNEEQILAVYRRAAAAVLDSSPMKSLLDEYLAK